LKVLTHTEIGLVLCKAPSKSLKGAAAAIYHFRQDTLPIIGNLQISATARGSGRLIWHS
jgi:hypothetical protein